MLQSLHLKHGIAVENGQEQGARDLPINVAVLTSHCCCHAVHNSVKWALRLADRAEAGKQLWGVISSLRSCFMELQSALMEFIQERIVYGDHPWILPTPHATELYTLLGVPTDMMDVYVRFRPTFQEGHLYVCADAGDQEDLDEQLMSMLLHALRFVGFSESRWCSLGESSRSLLLGLSLGLPAVIDIAQQHKLSQYGLSGAEALAAPELRSLVVEAALVTACPDTLLSTMLADDRILQIGGDHAHRAAVPPQCGR